MKKLNREFIYLIIICLYRNESVGGTSGGFGILRIKECPLQYKLLGKQFETNLKIIILLH